MSEPAAKVEGAPKPGSPEDELRIAKEWLEKTYVGDKVPQLTFRAVLTGMLIGGVMALSNLVVGFKTGWGLGVTITACILAYAIFSGLQKVVPALAKNEFTILENNMMSSAASAAGYMSSSIFIGAVPALYLATHTTLNWLELALWASAVSFLGCFMAIPMKRQQINIDQLPFPSGIATAETLKAMHTKGGDAKQKAWALGIAAIAGATLGWLRDGTVSWMRKINIPGMWEWKWRLFGQPMNRLTLGMEWSLIMIGAGAMIGIRVGFSLLLSALVCYGIFGPYVLNREWVELTRYRQAWALWPGVALLVTSGLTMFFMRWRTIVRAFSGLGRLLSGRGAEGEADPLKDVEAPQSWFLWGTGVSGIACVILGMVFFGIHWWMGVIAVVLTFFLALIASRATGETDITPTGAMGKITQLTYGLLAPGNMKVNLMTASLTGGAAIHSADLLTDLKSGYVLGANPRRQLIAQLWGIAAGTLFVVPAYLVMIRPEDIGTDRWPAPAAQIWSGVAQLLAEGFSALPRGATKGIFIGGAVGIVLALIEDLVPKKLKKYTLSSTAVGIAWVIPAWNSFSMFLGALLAWIFFKVSKEKAERYNLALASGFIAGESLLAVLIGFLIWFNVIGH